MLCGLGLDLYFDLADRGATNEELATVHIERLATCRRAFIHVIGIGLLDDGRRSATLRDALL